MVLCRMTVLLSFSSSRHLKLTKNGAFDNRKHRELVPGARQEKLMPTH